MTTPTNPTPPPVAPGFTPWLTEPKRTAFEHAGFPCITLRARGTHWCGYVGVPPGHPWHGLDDATIYGKWNEDYTEQVGVPAVVPSIHGGVTYGRKCDGDPINGVCHVAADGEPDDVWWIGFDCAHAGDFSPPAPELSAKHPDLFSAYPHGDEVYRDLAYITAETKSLADQALSAARGAQEGA